MKNFLEGRTLLKAENSSAPGVNSVNGFQPLFSALQKNGAEGTNGTNGHDGSHNDPQVELISHDGKIQRIIITCTCCRRIELECEY